MMLAVTFAIVLLVISDFTEGKPLSFDNQVPVPHPNRVTDKINVLINLGYLQEKLQYSEENIKEAIINFQNFGRIPQTGVIDSTTLDLINSRPCGVPDILRTTLEGKYRIGTAGWRHRNITYSFGDLTRQLTIDEVTTNIRRALNTWGSHVNLTFTRLYDSIGDIHVSFKTGYHGDGRPFDGPGGETGHAFFPQIVNRYYRGHIHFDDAEKWVVQTQVGDNNFYIAALHETGHALGLEHSYEPNAIMFPYYNQQTSSELSSDDINGIKFLYR